MCFLGFYSGSIGQILIKSIMEIAKPVRAAHVVATDDDENLVRVIEQYEEYLADQQHAIELLKQGFLKLTMAKMNLSTHALSELSYKDDFEAALYVTEEHDGTLTIVKDGDRVTNSNSPPDSPVGPSSNVLKRRKETEATKAVDEAKEVESRPVSTRANEEDATIMWFSSLPPTNLRVAQKNFRSALHALLTSAASARKIHSGVHELTSRANQS